MDTKWYSRYLEKNTDIIFKKGKVFVLYGPRRVGKTELIRKISSNFQGKIYSGTGDNQELRELIASQQLGKLSAAFGSYELIFIDEAQRIPGIGFGLKLLIDQFPELIIIVTGSSSFDLSNKIGEPLTGRSTIRILFSLSVYELYKQHGGMEILQLLDELLIFGAYPEVMNSNSANDKIEYLLSIRDSYLFKDVLELENLRNPAKLTDLLKLLAFQIGNEVSLNELSNQLGIAKQSVERYLDLLEKTFIIKKVGGFARNLRKEIVKTARYYFWDNGIRNAIINNFNPLDQRNDTGMLWENFMFMERLKTKEYKRIFANNYFWRTYDRQEIDLVEEREGKLFGYEFKYSPRKIKVPKAWMETYPESEFTVISKENFLEFLI
ncbi:MAG: ATP-binding protein [Prolixibacteraceae bacterium]|jgi:predicted AAA+ superfamily ATPase|nr:ATP-binding protein [Prolixibacteraceae bacterium]